MVPRNRLFRVYVSSTLTDMKTEREALQRQVFPKLQELCLAYGYQFQAVDLRWNISDKVISDQQNTSIYLKELTRCQQTSSRPNFIFLLGNRYGWRPLPSEIPANEFEEIVHQLPNDKPERQRRKALLEHWYKQDTNNIPPIYCLQLHEEYRNPETWPMIKRDLYTILSEAINKMDLDFKEHLRYEASAIEQEIYHGVLEVPDADKHVFGFFRTIENLPKDNTAGEFIDLDVEGKPDADAHTRLELLKEKLQNKIPNNIFKYEAQWTGNGISADHLNKLCEDVLESLTKTIEKEIKQHKDVNTLQKEITTHSSFSKRYSQHFIGRNDVRESIKDYVEGEARQPLVVYGDSGTGISAIMGYASEMIQSVKLNAVTIIRFIGKTLHSSDGRALLESICREISHHYGEDEISIPMDYRALIQEFSRQLSLATAEKPLIIFLDSLDKLSDVYNFSDLVWLPQELPKFVRIVLSTTLLDGSPGKSLVTLGTRIPEENFIKIEPLSEEEGDILLEIWLKNESRTLQKHQREEILNKFKKNGSAFYLRLAFEETRRWKSYTDMEQTSIPPEIKEMIKSLAERLSTEANHGKILVKHSLAYLAAAKHGLSENELLDILAFDDDVWKEFLKDEEKSPSNRKLPMILWSRLYHDLEPYLTEWDADETTLLTLHHQQIVEAIKINFLTDDRKKDYHRILAEFFYRQPLLYRKNQRRFFNLRRLSEQPYQQMLGQLWQKLEETLTDFEFIEVKCHAGMVEDLKVDYSTALMTTDQGKPGWRRVKEFTQFVYSQAHILSTYPDLTFQQAVNLPATSEPYLEARSRWSDGKETRPWFDWVNRPLGREACIMTFVGHSAPVSDCTWSPDGTRIVSGSWDHTLALWNPILDRMVIRFSGHSGSVNACAWSPDGTRIVSASMDRTLKIWDPETGKNVATLFGHTEGVNLCAWSPDGKKIVSAALDRTLRIWDALTSKEIVTISGHTGEIWACAWSPDGNYIISSSMDGTLRMWDAHTGTIFINFLTHNDSVNACVWSPDGTRIVSASGDHTLIIWNPKLARETIVLSGHTDSVIDCAWSPDGTKVVSASMDKTLRLWDTKTGNMIAVLTGHTEGVQLCAWSPDGTQLVSAAMDQTLRIWDAKTGREIATLSDHSGLIKACAWSPDGTYIISASMDRTLRIWDVVVATSLTRLTGHSNSVVDCAWSPDGTRIVSASWDRTLRIWDAQTAIPLAALYGHTNGVESCAWSPDGTRIVSASWDQTLRVWDAMMATPLAMLSGHAGKTEVCDWSPDGTQIVSGDIDGLLRIWDTNTSKVIMTLSGHTGSVNGCTWSPDGTRIVSASMDQTLRIWDAKTGKEVIVLSGHTGGVVDCDWSPDGTRIVSVSWDRTLRIWDAKTGKELMPLSGHTGYVLACAWSPDGTKIASASIDRTLRIWDASIGTTTLVLSGHTDSVETCIWSPDGTKIASGSMDQTLRIWNAITGSPIATLSGHTGGVINCAWSSDGTRIASASYDETLRIWDANTGNSLATLSDHSGSITACAWSPDAKRLVSTSGDERLRVWDAVTGTPFTVLSGHSKWVSVCAWSPDGNRIVSASGDQTLRVWDVTTGTSPLTLSGHFGPINACAWSPDGKKIASASWDQTSRVWDATTGKELVVMSGHSDDVRICAWSPDGIQIVSASDDQTLRTWDARTGIPLATLSGHTGWVRTCAWSPDGTKIASASWDGTVRIWDARTGKGIFTLLGHSKEVYDCAWFPDGEKIVSVSNDSKLILWNVSTGSKLATFIARKPLQRIIIGHRGKTIVTADDGGTLYFLHPLGVDFGTPIVTPVYFFRSNKQTWDDYASIKCECCSQWFPLENEKLHLKSREHPVGCLGEEIECPHCQETLKINPFVVNRP
ncbi:MAG: DUF4062 domain-containing protein [Promethearchaeota archaeon]